MHSGQSKSENRAEGQGDFSARAAYDGMASFYDSFTAHHDYELWLGNLLPAIEAHGRMPGKTLLDVGCGTGKSFLPMVDRGWSVTGVDLSPGMVEQAREKIDALRGLGAPENLRTPVRDRSYVKRTSLRDDGVAGDINQERTGETATTSGSRSALQTTRTRCRLRQRNASLVDLPSARFLSR